MRFAASLVSASWLVVAASAGLAVGGTACDRGRERTASTTSLTATDQGRPDPVDVALARIPDDAAMAEQRRGLVESVRAHGVTDQEVLNAIATVPRHELVPPPLRSVAYDDRPLPIGEGQTISQPSLVALMTEQAGVKKGERVLEVGTGSGYQGAILAELGADLYTIEIIEPLGRRAREDLERLGYADRIHFRIGDGYGGWPEAAPFDAIIVTAAPPKIPEPLVQQLAMGGRIVVPVGTRQQELRVLERTEGGLVERASVPVRFVPMTGRAQQR